MRKIIVLILASVGGYFMYTRMGVHEKLSGILEPKITISDLKSRPSVFADSLIEVKDLRVIETQSVMNYSRCKVSDETGQEMVLLSSRPYSTGETVNTVKGRYTVLFANNEKRFEVFISEDLKPFSDFMKLIKLSLLN